MNPITQTIKAQLQEFDENFYEVMGCETDPNGTKNIYLIRNEDGEILNGIDFYDELKELKPHLTQSHIALLESVVGVVEAKKKKNCYCPPFHSKHNGRCDDKDHTELNTALQDILTELQEALKELKDKK